MNVLPDAFKEDPMKSAFMPLSFAMLYATGALILLGWLAGSVCCATPSGDDVVLADVPADCPADLAAGTGCLRVVNATGFDLAMVQTVAGCGNDTPDYHGGVAAGGQLPVVLAAGDYCGLVTDELHWTAVWAGTIAAGENTTWPVVLDELQPPAVE